ncbi:MAG: hypothetical protein QGF00_33010 [Planctomycetota bacterium]|jgi:uncharacterized membrane protein|nr:hypothetical protein [Planctomycetota bacterium]MDP7254463.1 hypothetical protein [Planctomycetota bacterium]
MNSTTEGDDRRSILSDNSPLSVSFGGACMFILSLVIALITMLGVKTGNADDLFLRWGAVSAMIALWLGAFSALPLKPLMASAIWVQATILFVAIFYSGVRWREVLQFNWMTMELFGMPTLCLPLPWLGCSLCGRILKGKTSEG